MQEINIAIVVVAFNRPSSLGRLLKSVGSAIYPQELKPELVISIDYSGSSDCLEVAEGFEWSHGKKTIHQQTRNLGLKDHILKCADLSKDFDFIILLEDDLYVSRHYFDYSVEAYKSYRDEPRIAGISLYSYYFNETANKSFVPIHDGSDVFFLQLPSSWGQVWTARQWAGFRDWLQNEYSPEGMQDYLVPENVAGWPETSWKKLFIFYMIANDLYFVHPRLSLSTNFMDYGTHHKFDENFLQVPLQAHPKQYSFKSMRDTEILYDAFCELNPQVFKTACDEFESFDFEVDLYGTKPIDRIRRRYILSGRVSYNPLFQYGLSLKPHELNILYKLQGKDLFFARTSTIAGRQHVLSEQQRNSYYFGIPQFLIKSKEGGGAAADKRSDRWLFYVKQTIFWRVARAMKNRVVGVLKKIKYRLGV